MEDAMGAELVSFRADTNKPAIVVISVILVVLVVTGNTLVIRLFLTKKHVRTGRNMYIAFLALTDLLVGLVIIPLDILHETDIINPVHVTCKVLEFQRYFVLKSNLYFVVAIATDRYQSIGKVIPIPPSMKRVCSTAGIIWMCSALYAIKGPLTYDVVRHYDANVTSDDHTSNRFVCEVTNNRLKIHMLILDFFVHFVIPVSTITSLYLKIVFRVVKQRKPTLRWPVARKRNFKVVKMVVLMIILYVACQLPAQIWRLYIYTGSDIIDKSGYVMNILMFLTYTNSWINVLLYVIFNDGLLKRRQDFVPCCSSSAVGPTGNIKVDTIAISAIVM